MVKRIYVEKKEGFNIEALTLKNDLIKNLEMEIDELRIINRYDIEGFVSLNVFYEPPVDNIYEDDICLNGYEYFGIEYLNGQYDQRADSAEQCLQILGKSRPIVKTAKIIAIKGGDIDKIKNYCLNPVDSQFADFSKKDTLKPEYEKPKEVKILDGFINLDRIGLEKFHKDFSLAMDLEDLVFCFEYFKNTEKRDPTITEIKVIDTYWSDHCRHTTFLTKLNNIKIEDPVIKEIFEDYLNTKKVYNINKDVCLMDLATIAAKKLKKDGVLVNLDESEEINACSVKIKVNVENEKQDWLLMFKNETHNHPTEIEPFGGAATCLGGAIRDPLSGRSYVYQAMRITGAADPNNHATLLGKLSQYKITTTAARGYSSYGNQIGLATGYVDEIYDDGYIAKRLETGAVIGAAPAENVVRMQPEPSDIILLLGGRTGRDGIGGATGSSKVHTLKSLSTCEAEVQKGNPPEERKLQRLFRNPEVSRLIKRCNDFGAGGVAVAIGELAPGLDIDLDSVLKKYMGLDGTELAISESQERMAVLLDRNDIDKFIKLAEDENIEATKVAEVTGKNRLRMFWGGKLIVNIEREFLNSNGAPKYADVFVKKIDYSENYFDSNNGLTKDFDFVHKKWLKSMADLNVCSKKGLVEMFDSTIGAGTVVMPFGGKHQLTPSESMIAKIPVLNRDTTTKSIMAAGFNPKIFNFSPFYGAIYSVIESVSKVVAAGGRLEDIYLSFQEYFERMTAPEKWGKPLSALLGAYMAQLKLGIAAIGGKDSMSGSFNDLNVPPTLISFAVAVCEKAISGEFKKVGSKVYIARLLRKQIMPDFEKLKEIYNKVTNYIQSGKIISAYTVKHGGIAEAVSKMCFGNKIGFRFRNNSDLGGVNYFYPDYGSIILEAEDDLDFEFLGTTIAEEKIQIGNGEICIEEILSEFKKPLENIFPTKASVKPQKLPVINNSYENIRTSSIKSSKPKVIIPVFYGTNCEYDTAYAFEKAGGDASIFVMKTLSNNMIGESIDALCEKINESRILMFPGGFSAGDEPEGSGKFIAAVFKNEKLKEAVHELLYKRDGLILGICNGFQVLIKLGLLPYGKIQDLEENSPTLTYNQIGRHVSCMVRTKIVSNLSPWLSGFKTGETNIIPVSHGEGRFVVKEEVFDELVRKGQIASQYVDFNNNPSLDINFNPNGSMYAVEGITSEDGKVFGKMAHNERAADYINIPNYNSTLKIFESGIQYFK